MSFARKARAIAAGGAVLGLGTAITLAAWSDNEWAKGTFSTAQFGIEGSNTSATDGFSNHTTSDAALALDFGAGAGQTQVLQGGQTVTEEYWIRNIAGGVDSTVTYTEQTGTATPFTVEVKANDNVINTGGTFDLSGQTAEKITVTVTLPESTASDAEVQTADLAWHFTAAPKEA